MVLLQKLEKSEIKPQKSRHDHEKALHLAYGIREISSNVWKEGCLQANLNLGVKAVDKPYYFD
jgi:hypothetical protein